MKLQILFFLLIFIFGIYFIKSSKDRNELYKKINHLEKKNKITIGLFEEQLKSFQDRKTTINSYNSGELTQDEMNPSIPLSLKIVIPTIPRKEKGYEYMKRTFSSIQKNFDAFNVKFKVLAYSTSNIKPDIDDKRFEFYQMEQVILPKEKIPKEIPGYTRAPLVLRQNLDWITMMTKFQKEQVKEENEVFLYMEDDFIICENAESHILSIYLWALKYRRYWKSIRTSIGFSGLFLQTRDINEYINTIWEDCLNPKKILYPIDYGLAMKWTHINNTKERVHYTFKYNLFEHIGLHSTVGNNMDHHYNPKCFDGMAHSFNFYLEKFDTSQCEEYMISPCYKKEIIMDFDLHGLETIQVRPLLKYKDRNLLMKKLNAHLIQYKIQNQESCDDICSKYDMICEPKFYIFANSCDEFKRRFLCKYPCISQMWNVWDKYLPFYQDGHCVLHDHPRYICNSKVLLPKGSEKLCPCKPSQ